MFTSGMALQGSFVPNITERRQYQRQTGNHCPNILMPLALLAATSVATHGSEWPVSSLAGAGRTCICCTSCSGASESAELILEGHV